MALSTYAVDASLDTLHSGLSEPFLSMQETLHPLRIARQELVSNRQAAGTTRIVFDCIHQRVAMGMPVGLSSTLRTTMSVALCSKRGTG
jgi:flagellar motor switch protein FliM